MNYLKFAVRSIRKNVGVSAINIVGLTVSLTCFLQIFVWVCDQLSYDRFFKDSGHIYRVNTMVRGREVNARSPENIAPGLIDNYANVVSACRIDPFNKTVVVQYGSHLFPETGELSADSNFFDFFSYDLVCGDRKNVLKSPDNVVITKSMALSIFGDADPVGKMLTINPGIHERRLMVSGIAEDVPENSHLKFRFVTLLRNLPFWGNGWTYLDIVSYIRLSEHTEVSSFEKEISEFIRRFDPTTQFSPRLQPLTEIYLNSSSLTDAQAVASVGDKDDVYVFIIIALLVLVIASVNFTNLTIASSLGKIKNAGTRKAFGAGQRHIVLQCVTESVLVVILAAIGAMALFELGLPAYNRLTGFKLGYEVPGAFAVVGFVAMVLCVGVLSGVYPAILVSSPRSSEILRNPNSYRVGGMKTNAALLGLQFVVSIGLIISVIVLENQLHFILNKDLGFERNGIIYFNGHNLPNDPKEHLLKIPSVMSVTWTSELPLMVNYELQDTEWDGRRHNDVRLHYLRADEDFLKTFDVRLKEGRGFRHGSMSDRNAYIINETAEKVMNLGDPLGKRLVCLTGLKDKVPGEIVGVVKDFHFGSLHGTIEPLVIGMSVGKPWYVCVRVAGADFLKTTERIKETMHTLYPNNAIDFKFLDETFEKQYDRERRMGNLLEYFSIVVILISCSGLFALVAISMRMRTREIGIRKVLGATVTEVVFLLGRRYVLTIVVAGALACPLAYVAMKMWLQNFAYRIQIEWWVFALSFAISLVIAMAAIGIQTVKAATSNPVESLRYE